jgi:hypothetical protein
MLQLENAQEEKGHATRHPTGVFQPEAGNQPPDNQNSSAIQQYCAKTVSAFSNTVLKP